MAVSDRESNHSRIWDLRLFRWLGGQPRSMEEPDLPGRAGQTLTGRMCRAYTALRLDRILRGSLLLRPEIWIILTLTLLPFLPTMAALVLCAVSLGTVLLSRCDARTGTGPLRFREDLYSPGLRLCGLLSLVYLLAVAASVSPARSLYPGLLTAFFMLFAFASYGGISDGFRLRACFAGITLGAMAVSLYGLWQWLHPEAYTTGWLDTDMFSSIEFRVYSTLQNPNVLGEFFLLTIPFALALALSAGDWKQRLLWGAALALMCVCAVLTYSRGCYLGLILALAVFLVLLDRRFLILIAVLALISPWVLPHAVVDRLMSIGNLEDTSTDYRFQIWQGVAAMLKDFWYCGVGPGEGAFYSVYPVYALEAVDAPHSHCLYLQLLCDTGAAGLLVFLALAGSLLRSLLTTLRTALRRETRLFAMAGISAFSGFLLQSFTDYSFYNYRVMLLFFGLAGLCLLLRHMDALPEREERKEKKTGRRICPADLVLLAAAVAAGLLLWGAVHRDTADGGASSRLLLEDLRRSSLRYNDPAKLEEQEEYNVSYIVEMKGLDPVCCENIPEPGGEICDAYSKTSVGTLKDASVSRNPDGTADITLTICKYSIFTKKSITTPDGYEIRVGNSVSLENGDQAYLGSGTITWISH